MGVEAGRQQMEDRAEEFLHRRALSAESKERVQRLAGAVRHKLGLVEGARGAILALNSDRYFEFSYALPWAGCVFVPINLAMSLVLIWFAGVREAAFAISTSTTSTLTVLVGLVLLQRKTATRLVSRSALWAAVRMLGAAVASILVVSWLRQAWTTRSS